MKGRRALGWLIGLVVVALVLLIADRVAASVAGKTAATFLGKQALFETKPTVDVRGFPFLIQAIHGRYDDVEVRSKAVMFGAVEATDLDARLHGVHLPLSAAIGTPIRSLPVDTVDGTLVLSYPQIEKLSTIPDLAISDPNGQLHVSASLAVPGLSKSTTVTGVGTVRVVDGTLRLAVTQLTVAGLSVSQTVLAALASSLAAPITIPALPYGLVLDTVTTQRDGVLVTGSGRNVVIGTT